MPCMWPKMGGGRGMANQRETETVSHFWDVLITVFSLNNLTISAFLTD